MKHVFFAALAALAVAGCVPKKQYVDMESRLKAVQGELDALKPELEAKTAELDRAAKELEEAKSRLAELDEAQKRMEESLKSELEQKTIKLEKLNDRLTVTFVDKILFDSGSDVIKEAGKSALKKVADSLKEMSGHHIHVEGHTDDQKIGSALAKRFPSNWELSSARATSVVKFLQESGVPAERMYAVGGGMYHPVASNAAPAGRAENRRVEIVLSPVLAKK